MKANLLGWLTTGLVMSLFAAGLSAQANTPESSARAPEIGVILWFDTEDYLLPADDDAAKRLAEMLSRHHIQATFKVVGEKARVLERRGRRDVIDALGKHAIGFHANFHSVHPTPTEYLADCGLLDGMEEFVRREGPGAADVRRIFGLSTLACYGQPGSSWAPQAIAALGACGIGTNRIPCYLDSGRHVGFGDRPFWYAGALNVYDMGRNETRMDLWADGGLERGEKSFAAIAQRLAAEGGGLISIFYHPCEWVHQEFWDGVNFRRGANPPREDWRPPPQKPAEQTEQAFARFEKYVDFMLSRPGVHFITARDLPDLYPDPVRSDGATEAQLVEISHRMLSSDSKGLDDQQFGDEMFSPADQFALLAFAIARGIDKVDARSSESIQIPPGLLGPDAQAPAQAPARTLSWPAFRDATLDVRDFLRTSRRIPSRVFIGADPVAPADYAVAMAAAYVAVHDSNQFPPTVALPAGTQVLTMRHVAQDTPGLFGGWIIHKEAFRAPKVMEEARLQAWTLKPAVRRK
jgi:hypothetical protein